MDDALQTFNEIRNALLKKEIYETTLSVLLIFIGLISYLFLSPSYEEIGWVVGVAVGVSILLICKVLITYYRIKKNYFGYNSREVLEMATYILSEREKERV